jgi:hypothetical protein
VKRTRHLKIDTGLHSIGSEERHSPHSLLNIVQSQPEHPDNRKYLQDLPGVLSLDLGLDEVDLGGSHTWKAARGQVLFDQCVLLVPLVSEPELKLLRVVEGNVRDAEAAPVKVDRLGRLALKICAGETEELLAIFTATASKVSILSLHRPFVPNLRDTFIRHSAVIYPFNCGLKLVEAEEGAGAPREHDVLRVLKTLLLSPGSRFHPPIV